MSRAVVVGAGVFGLSVARELAGRGWAVQLVDRQEPGLLGPSAARWRMLRCAHGPDAWYAESAWRARQAWLELEAECRVPLFVPCGVLTIAGPDEPEWAAESCAVLDRLGIPVEPLTGSELTARFPGFSCNGGASAIHEPSAGVLRAGRASRALLASALRRGVRQVRGSARPEQLTAEQLTSGQLRAGQLAAVRVGDRVIEADLVVWAVGSALPELFPGLTSAVAVPERTADFRPAPIPPAAEQPRFGGAPAWLDRGRDLYGFPPLDGFGPRVGPAVPERDTWWADLAALLPGLADLPLAAVEPCEYTAMPDGHFLLAEHPDHAGVWLLGGDSGHGFKHGPAWGAFAADVITGRVAPPDRFRLR